MTIKMLSLAAVTMAVVLGGCATSDTNPTSAPTAEQVAATNSASKAEAYNESVAEEDRVYCRRVVVTGSHKKRTVCRTASQRRAEAEAAQEAIRSVTRGAAKAPPGDR